MTKVIRIDSEVYAALFSLDSNFSQAIRKVLSESGLQWAWWCAYRLEKRNCREVEYTWHISPRRGRIILPLHPKKCPACASQANKVVRRALRRGVRITKCILISAA